MGMSSGCYSHHLPYTFPWFRNSPTLFLVSSSSPGACWPTAHRTNPTFSPWCLWSVEAFWKEEELTCLTLKTCPKVLLFCAKAYPKCCHWSARCAAGRLLALGTLSNSMQTRTHLTSPHISFHHVFSQPTVFIPTHLFWKSRTLTGETSKRAGCGFIPKNETFVNQ